MLTWPCSPLTLSRFIVTCSPDAVPYLPADLTKHPVEGFSAGLVDDDNVYEWEITIFG